MRRLWQVILFFLFFTAIYSVPTIQTLQDRPQVQHLPAVSISLTLGSIRAPPALTSALSQTAFSALFSSSLQARPVSLIR